MKRIEDTDEISWNNSNCFILREEKLCEIDYESIEIGETYCMINQTPSTPADFGLVSAIKSKPQNMGGFKFNSPIMDEMIHNVLDYMIINPKGIKHFILNPKEFKNYYETNWRL